MSGTGDQRGPQRGSRGSIEEWNALRDALAPLAAIADVYDENGLDEARPEWVPEGVSGYDVDVELFRGEAGVSFSRCATRCRLGLR